MKKHAKNMPNIQKIFLQFLWVSIYINTLVEKFAAIE